MKFKAVVFDLDGTLIDTIEDIGDSVNRVLATRGFATHTMENYRDFIGDGPKELVTRALPLDRRRPEIIADCLEAYMEDYGNNCDKKTRLFDGIAALLDELVQRGRRITVLSNKRHDLTRICVNRFLGKWHFDVVFGLRTTVPRKPHPAGALEISDHLSIPPQKMIYVGDSGTDMETAKAADMFPVGVGWGYRRPDELKNKGAQIILAHPLALLDIQGMND